MPYTEQLPSRLKDREEATLVLLSTICLQEGLGGVCQRKHRPPRHLKEPRSGPLNHCRSFYLCDWSASFSRSSQHTGRACPNVHLPESGTQYKANTETLTAAAAMGFPPQTLIITQLDDFWPTQTQQRLGFLLRFGFLTAAFIYSFIHLFILIYFILHGSLEMLSLTDQLQHSAVRCFLIFAVVIHGNIVYQSAHPGNWNVILWWLSSHPTVLLSFHTTTTGAIEMWLINCGFIKSEAWHCASYYFISTEWVKNYGNRQRCKMYPCTWQLFWCGYKTYVTVLCHCLHKVMKWLFLVISYVQQMTRQMLSRTRTISLTPDISPPSDSPSLMASSASNTGLASINRLLLYIVTKTDQWVKGVA